MSQAGEYNLVAPKARPTTVSEVVDFILAQSLKLMASDIHIGMNQNPLAKEPCLLRVRINGKLVPLKSDILNTAYTEIIARIKILASINTSETGVPQDGQVNVATGDGNVTLRVSTVPSIDHEEIVIRIQRGSDKVPALEYLGMTKIMLTRMQTLIQQKSGMIILNGPAGSGKTTTIYSLLATLASPERKVITAEDPVEMRLPYVSHMQVSEKLGFAQLARAFMRQDAEVIFIGEVRDAESAEIAVQLAQTGHLVVTTLHTRDAIGVVQRLANFGVHPSFIGNTLIGSLSQRLVPLLCQKCRQEYQPPQRLVDTAVTLLPLTEGAKFYKAGPGCPICQGGIAGRIPVFELFLVDTAISDLISRNAPKATLLEVARQKGMKSLAEEALMRVYAGYADLASVAGFIFETGY